jgi:hypothetical protein
MPKGRGLLPKESASELLSIITGEKIVNSTSSNFAFYDGV